MASDARLVAYVREGRSGAFETLYDRHHRGILSFCRHLLGDQHEAEDAVQHTFMAAYSSLLASHQPINLRPWLFTIARNRCYSVLRAQRERPAAELDEPATEGLAVEVERRQDLRDLVLDLGRLPDDQRAAIVLAELESLSHAEIAQVLSIPRDKVKALVFQARESLMASRSARDTACHEIRTQLAVGRGGALRRANLRRHLRDCESCRIYRTQVQRQRRQFAALLPVAPTLLAKEGLTVAAVGAGGAAAVGGSGLIATSAIKTGFLKGVAAAIIAGAGTLGTVVVSATNLPVHALGGNLVGTSPAEHVHHRARPAAEHHRTAPAAGTATGVQAGDVIQHSTVASTLHRTSTRAWERHHAMTWTREHHRRGAAARERRAERARRHHGIWARGHGQRHGLGDGWSNVTGSPGTYPVAPRATGPGVRTVGHILLGVGGQSTNPGHGWRDGGHNVPPGWAHKVQIGPAPGSPAHSAPITIGSGTNWHRHSRNVPPGWARHGVGPAAQHGHQIGHAVATPAAPAASSHWTRHVGHIRIQSPPARHMGYTGHSTGRHGAERHHHW